MTRSTHGTQESAGITAKERLYHSLTKLATPASGTEDGNQLRPKAEAASRPLQTSLPLEVEGSGVFHKLCS